MNKDDMAILEKVLPFWADTVKDVKIFCTKEKLTIEEIASYPLSGEEIIETANKMVEMAKEIEKLKRENNDLPDVDEFYQGLSK